MEIIRLSAQIVVIATTAGWLIGHSLDSALFGFLIGLTIVTLLDLFT